VRELRARAGFRKMEAVALCKLATVHILLDEGSSAAVVAKQAVTLAVESGDRRCEASARLVLGRSALADGDFEEAQRAGEEAAALFGAARDHAQETSAVEVIVNSYLQRSDLNAAVRVATEVMNRFAAARNLRMQASMMIAVADVNLQAQDVEGALVFLKKARVTFSEAKDSVGEAGAFHRVAQLCATIGDAEEALWSIQRGTALFRKLKDKSGEGGILLVSTDLCFAKSWGYVAMGSQDKSVQEAKDALRNAELALRLFRAAGDKRGQALALLSVANAQLMLKDVSGCSSSASDCLVLCEEIAFDVGRAGALLLSAGSHLADGHMDPAENSANQALLLFRQRGDSMGTDAAGNFLKDLRSVVSGATAKENFPGFYLRGTDSFQPLPQEVAAKTARSTAERRQQRAPPRPVTANCMIFSPDGEMSVFFDGFEGRLATVSQTTRIRRAEVEEAPGAVEDRPSAGPRYRAEVPPVYAVRWQGVQAQPRKPLAEGTPPAGRVEGAYYGSTFIDAGPVGAGTTFPPMFKVSAAR